MSIYIARGDDTLGPYTPADAADLIERGHLSPDDLAARNGDAAWVALSSLLPAATVPDPAPEARGTSLARGRRGHWLWATVLLVLALLAVGSPLIFRSTKDQRGTRQPATPTPVARAKAPVPPATPVAATPSPPGTPSPPIGSVPSPPTPPPPVAEPGGRLGGTISFAAPGSPPAALSGVRVLAYRLETLRQYLAQKQAAAQAELARIAPLLAAAETERTARAAAEQSALQAFHDADSSDDLRSALQFAYVQAKSATKATGVDCDYYLEQRRTVTSGEFYFQDLPPPLATAETDERGEFSLDLPPGGPFAVAASARQNTAEGASTHFWMVKISLADANNLPLRLSDQNDSSAASGESLIHPDSP